MKYSHTETTPCNFPILMFEVPNTQSTAGTWTFANWIRHLHEERKGRREGRDDPPSLDSPTYWRYYHLIPYLSGLYLSEEKLDFSSNKWWVKAGASVSCLLSVADMVWLMSNVQHITCFWRIHNINIICRSINELLGSFNDSYSSIMKHFYQNFMTKNLVINFILWFSFLKFYSGALVFIPIHSFHLA